MNKLAILLLSTAAATALVIGCSDETGTGSGSSQSTSSSATSSGAGGEMNNFGNMPGYGAQLDRFGRPAINTALNNTFSDNMEQKDQAKDAWNADDKVDGWPMKYRAEIAKNLAVLDALDATCGNQLLAGKDVVAGRYDTLANILADDRQWLNANGTSCDIYLGVEANAVPILPNMDCGGRALKYDVIDISYSALAAGALMGVTDDIAAGSSVGGEIFPYLGVPQ
jgi:hypothetical protein